MRAEAILSKRNGSNSCIGCGGGEAARWSFRPIDDSYFTIGLSECDMNRSSSLWLLAFTNKTHFLCMLTTRTTPGEPLCRVYSVCDILKFSVRGHSVLCLCHFLSDMFCAVLNSAQALFRAILLCHFPSDTFNARLNSAQVMFRAIPRANAISRCDVADKY